MADPPFPGGFGGGTINDGGVEQEEENAPYAPVSQSAHSDVVFGDAISGTAKFWGHILGDQRVWAGLANTAMPGMNAGAPSLSQMRGDLPPITPPDDTISAEEANARYGSRSLRWNTPVSDYDAAWAGVQDREQAWKDSIFAKTNPQPLTDFGLSLAGGILDPGNLPLMWMGEGLGAGVLDAAGGAIGAGRDALAGLGWTLPGTPPLVGRLMNAARVPVEGALDFLPFAGQHALESEQKGEPYTPGDALEDMAFGAIMHTGSKIFGGALKRLLSSDAKAKIGQLDQEANPDTPDVARINDAAEKLVPPEGVPPEVERLSPEARAGAWGKALDDASQDRDTDVAKLIDQETEQPDLDRLSETTAQLQIPSFRPVDENFARPLAISTEGTETPVRYGLVEADDLVTSHSDAMQENPAFPPELQPRDRATMGSQAANMRLQSVLNVKRMFTETAAEGGAPIVSPDGVVESGNGRVIILRRSSRGAGPGGRARYEEYLAEMKAHGLDVEGMKTPILVRVRTEPLTGSQRAKLTSEWNNPVTETLTPTEQAMSDARRVGPDMLSKLAEGRGAVSEREFAKAFLARVAPEAMGSLVDDNGFLTQKGADRVDAALVAKAFGSPQLVSAIFESKDTDIKTIGDVLREVAPAWAIMRDAIERGEVDARMDPTASLRSAIALIDTARGKGIKGAKLAKLIKEQLEEQALFTGVGISDESKAFLQVLLGENFTRATAKSKVAAALEWIAEEIQRFDPSPDLFGEKLEDAPTALNIAKAAFDKFVSNDPSDDSGRLPGIEREPGATEPEPGGGEGGAFDDLVGGAGPAGDAEGGAGRGGGGGVGEPAAAEPAAGERAPGPAGTGTARVAKARGPALLAAAIHDDPELGQLAADNARMGIETPTEPGADNPTTLAEAFNAAAECLIGGLE